jgi:hypothetical protein
MFVETVEAVFKIAALLASITAVIVSINSLQHN